MTSIKNVTVPKKSNKKAIKSRLHLARALTEAVNEPLAGVGATGGALAHLGAFLGSALGSRGGGGCAAAGRTNLIGGQLQGKGLKELDSKMFNGP